MAAGKYEFEDDDGEVELRLPLPEELHGSDAAKKLIEVDTSQKALKVLRKDDRSSPLLDINDLYEKVKPSETAWYIDGGKTLVITLVKVNQTKWPALSDMEALEARFGPIRTNSGTLPAVTSPRKAEEQQALPSTAPTAGEGAGKDAESKSGDGSAAWATREILQRLLTAAQEGNVAGLKFAAAELAAADSGAGAKGGEGEIKESVGNGLVVQGEEELGSAAESATSPQDEKEKIKEALSSVKDANGRAPLHFAASKGQSKTVHYLLHDLGLNPNPKDDEGDTPLTMAAREGHAGVVGQLLEAGADVAAAAEKSGAQAIHHASGHGAKDVLQLLLRAGANPNAPSDAGPPLLWACGHGRTEVAEMLLDAGADPNGASEDGVSALLAAAAAGETEIVRVLLKKGADPNGKIGEDGGSGEGGGGVKVTPLFIAANEENKRMVELLLQAGASANATDEDGLLPVQVAAATGSRDLVKLLFQKTERPADVAAADWTVDALIKKAAQSGSGRRDDSGASQAGAGGNPGSGQGGGGGASTTVGSQSASILSADVKAATVKAKERADVAFKEKRFTEAVDGYTQAIDFHPTAVSASPVGSEDRKALGTLFSNRSLCWLRLGQADSALEDARKARELRPDWSRACFREGAALRLLLRFESAANSFFDGVQLDPNNMELATAFQEAVAAGRKAHEEMQAKGQQAEK